MYNNLFHKMLPALIYTTTAVKQTSDSLNDTIVINYGPIGDPLSSKTGSFHS